MSKYLQGLHVDAPRRWPLEFARLLQIQDREGSWRGYDSVHRWRDLVKDVFIRLPECGVRFDLVVAKIRARRVEENHDEPAYVDMIEFIPADGDGHQSAWPLNVSILHCLGEGDKRISRDVGEVVE